jgi:hypothetical protein
MWILTKIGFYSIIKKTSHLNPDGPAFFNIRGRDKDDLKRFAELVSPDLAKRPVVHEYAHSDYPYRVYLNTQEEMATCLAAGADGFFTDDVSMGCEALAAANLLGTDTTW